ncbi:MAG: hypothetical protein R2827_08495 [Bdellovibrionales bacterium]
MKSSTSAKRFVQKLENKYYDLFSLHEFESSKSLKAAFILVLIHFSFALKDWFFKPIATVQEEAANATLCWPHFQSCYKLNVLDFINYGFSHTYLYTALFTCLILAFVFVARKNWVYAHLFTSILFLWRFLYFFVVTYKIPAGYEYYSQPFAFILLFASNKLFLMRFCLAFLYFLSAQVKFYESWIVGTYFTSTHLGMPLFSDSLAPLATNLVILLEIFGSWALMLPRKKYFPWLLGLWILFHIYSVTIVGFNYPFYSALALGTFWAG